MSDSKKYLQTKKMIGNWQSKRLILDSLNKSQALYFGKMRITARTEASIETGQGFKNEFISFHLREEGKLTTKDKTYQFSQDYLLYLFEGRCDVFFNNKSFFFGINGFEAKQKIEHLCQLDKYIGQITFVNESSFLLSFNVSGPKKEYYLKVLYKRC